MYEYSHFIDQPLAWAIVRALSKPRLKAALFLTLSLIGPLLLNGWNERTGRMFLITEVSGLLIAILTYVLAARACLELNNYRLKSALFALVNIGWVGVILSLSVGRRLALATLVAYVSLTCVLYTTMWFFSLRDGWFSALAVLAPIVALIFVKYVLFVWEPVGKSLIETHGISLGALFIGISYMAFRLSHLVSEVRNGVVGKPSLWEYLGFAFFVPTIAVGPISPYSVHQRSINNPELVVTPVGLSLMRIVVGAAKYQFLGSMLSRLSYSALMLDGHPHSLLDLFVSAISFHLYLYCNFSGVCDMAIGTAGLLGIHVKENFNNPLAARNVKDYWNRWHITLSVFMRDMVFSPLSKWLVTHLGVRHSSHAIALAILVVFLLVGIWHGVELNYLVYGATQAVGVAANHYYTILLKKKLGKEGFRAYDENRLVKAVAVVTTFLYTSACLFFFANDFSTMKRIFDALN